MRLLCGGAGSAVGVIALVGAGCGGASLDPASTAPPARWMSRAVPEARGDLKVTPDGKRQAVRYPGWTTRAFGAFRTYAYDDTRPVPPVQKPAMPAITGDPREGRRLFVSRAIGPCTGCHLVPGEDVWPAGNVGPDLSTYGDRNLPNECVYDVIFDARTVFPNTAMPPWGTTGVLKPDEVIHLVAYLQRLHGPIPPEKNPERNPFTRPKPGGFGDNLDPTNNPAVLLDEGALELWRAKGPSGKACADCHEATTGGSMKGVATRYPRYVPAHRRVMSIEDLLTVHGPETTGRSLPAQSAENLRLTMLVKMQSPQGLRAHARDGGGLRSDPRRLRGTRRALRQARGLCLPRDPCGPDPRRAAGADAPPGWRRHAPGLGHRAVEPRRRHAAGDEPARRRRLHGALGVRLWHRPGQGAVRRSRDPRAVPGRFRGAQRLRRDVGRPRVPPLHRPGGRRHQSRSHRAGLPYTPVSHPRRFVPDLTFGIREEKVQAWADELRAGQRADVVVLLSHNGVAVDLKLASRVRGLDVILGGHTHDGLPEPIVVGRTLVVNSGSHGKFLSRLDLDVRGGRVARYRYKLLPVLSRVLPEDPAMARLIHEIRGPHEARLGEALAVSESLLYRRGNFNGSFDEVILDALLKRADAEIAFSPGFRWGITIVPGQGITLEDVYAHTALTYPDMWVRELTGAEVLHIMEDVADNLFHRDPYYRQGGDMVRLGGVTYAIDPAKEMGRRLSDVRVGGKPSTRRAATRPRAGRAWETPTGHRPSTWSRTTSGRSSG